MFGGKARRPEAKPRASNSREVFGLGGCGARMENEDSRNAEDSEDPHALLQQMEKPRSRK